MTAIENGTPIKVPVAVRDISGNLSGETGVVVMCEVNQLIKNINKL